jgi:hypothetical protein
VKGSMEKIRHDIVLGAIVWGLGMATKFNAIYVPIIWVLWDLGFRIYDLRIKNLKSYFLNLKSLIAVLVIGLITTFIVWPYLWTDTVAHAMEVVRYFTSVGQGYKFFWNGRLYFSGLGVSYWWYPLESFLLGTPVEILLCIGAGIALSISMYNKHPERIVLVIWIIIPFLRAFWPWASLYDQLRHFVETLPAFALCAAVFLQAVSRSRLRFLAFLAGTGIVVHLMVINITYFPYSAGYYNVVTKSANTNFDRDIEALSVKEGVDYLHKTYGTVALWAPIGGHLSWYYLNPPDRYVYNSSDADSIILINKSSHIREQEFTSIISDTYRIVHTITRGNAVFAWVYRKI